MSLLSSIGGFFGGGNSSNGWSNIFQAVLGGIAGRQEGKDAERATKEATREAGSQNRLTAQFQSDMDYFRSQQRRHETRKALDGSYNQFSTVRQWAPNYKPGPGLDALPAAPNPHNYRVTDEDEDDD